MSTLAQEEFNNLTAPKERVLHHPADTSDQEADDSNSDSDTLVGSKTQKSKSKSSLRSSQFDSRDSSDGDDSDGERGGWRRRRPATYALPHNYVRNANTGPKGVISDAVAFEREKGIGNKRTYVRTEDFVLPKNQRLWNDPRANAGAQEPGYEIDEHDDPYAEDEDGDDEVMRKWRERRVSEFKREMLTQQSEDRRGRYGTMRTVDALGFLETVDNVPKQTTVVVYVFDDDLPISDAYDTHFNVLAARHPHVKFVRLHYEEAEMEHAGVPAVLTYREGEQIAAIVPLRNEVPFTNDVVFNLEEAFKRHGII